MIVPFYNVSQPPACSFFNFISSALKTGLAILPLIFFFQDCGQMMRGMPEGNFPFVLEGMHTFIESCKNAQELYHCAPATLHLECVVTA